MLENALYSFFADNSDSFKLNRESGLIVFSKGCSKSALKKDLMERTVLEIKKYITPYDPADRRFYFMVGSCYPCNNILLKHLNPDKYFPEKVRKYIEDGNIKYFLKVDRIKIDLSTFNSIFEEIFEEFMKRGTLFKKFFKGNEKNLYFLKDYRLDCYMVYSIIKKHFGKVNVCNMFEENKKDMTRGLYSVNNKIDEYTVGIKGILESDELKGTVTQIKQFLDICVNNY